MPSSPQSCKRGPGDAQLDESRHVWVYSPLVSSPDAGAALPALGAPSPLPWLEDFWRQRWGLFSPVYTEPPLQPQMSRVARGLLWCRFTHFEIIVFFLLVD